MYLGGEKVNFVKMHGLGNDFIIIQKPTWEEALLLQPHAKNYVTEDWVLVQMDWLSQVKEQVLICLCASSIPMAPKPKCAAMP